MKTYPLNPVHPEVKSLGQVEVVNSLVLLVVTQKGSQLTLTLMMMMMISTLGIFLHGNVQDDLVMFFSGGGGE